MKRLVYFLLFLAAGCGKQNMISQSGGNFLRTADAVLTEIHIEALEGLADRAHKKTQTRSYEEMWLMEKVILDKDNYSWTSLPVRTLDEDTFMQDPRGERIIESLRALPPNKVAFLVEAKTGENYHFEGRKENIEGEYVWLSRLWETNMRSQLAWMGREMERADSRDYIIFDFGNLRYYILYFGGKPVFYDMHSKIWSGEDIANLLKYRIETARAAASGGPVIVM